MFHVEDAYNRVLTMVFIFNWTYVYVTEITYWINVHKLNQNAYCWFGCLLFIQVGYDY